MKKTWKIIYVVLSVAVMALPFAGMTFFKTDTTTENKRLAEMPEIKEDGQFNKDYLSELGTYFNDHFAFRNYLVDADSRIQSGVFGESNVETVLVGTDDWLYYTATIDNYLGQNRMTERTVNNCVHNMKLLQDYIESQGAKFVLAVPPNKNSLYGENMPYYYGHKVSDGSDMDVMSEKFVDAGVNYVDLYDILSEQKDTMYLKRDSHWNNMGALLAYNGILDTAGVAHDTYETDRFTRRKDYIGDLNSMIYPVSSQPEWDMYLDDSTWKYTYTTDTKSVEDSKIETSCGSGEGKLVMYRDSFGNTLLPYMANAFAGAYFSKNIPYNIASDMMGDKPDVVVVEKVERNVKEFASDPAVFQGPEPDTDTVSILDNIETDEKKATVNVKEAESNVNFWQIDGVVDSDKISSDTVIYVAVTDGDETRYYEAFGITDDKIDCGYRLYLDKTSVDSDNITVAVYTSDDSGQSCAASENIDLTTIKTINP